MRHGRGQAVIESPAIQSLNAMFQVGVLLRFRRQRLELTDQLEDVTRAGPDVFLDAQRRIQGEGLR